MRLENGWRTGHRALHGPKCQDESPFVQLFARFRKAKLCMCESSHTSAALS